MPGARPQAVPVYYQKSAEISDSFLKSKSTAEQTTSAASTKNARAFVSYSHKDANLLDKLHEHLSALKRQGLLDTWTDKEIHTGDIIDEQVDDQLEIADIYLLLISSAFIQSDYYFKKEFERACQCQREGKATIVPIIIRDCDWKIPALRQFKALPEDGSDGSGMAQSRRGIRKRRSRIA